MRARPRFLLTIIDLDMVDKQESKGFQWTLLSLLGASAVFAASLQVISPTNTVSKAPRTVLPMPEAVSISKADIETIAGKPDLKLSGRMTVNDLNTTFDQLGYKLAPVLEGESNVPRLFLTSLPYDLSAIKQTDERKSMFFRALLPLVLKINEEIVSNRAEVWRLRHRLEMNLSIKAEEHIWLKTRYDHYGVQIGKFDQLLQRMDVVPPSLALAQAAEESGWGTSRFVREGNALFGQWTFNPKDKGIVPAGRAEGKTHRIKAFDNLKGSLDAYVKNLNTHKAYLSLRQKRAKMRENRQDLNGFVLATALSKYSERGEKYVTSLQAIMDKNNLQRFDATALRNTEKKAPKGPLI